MLSALQSLPGLAWRTLCRPGVSAGVDGIDPKSRSPSLAFEVEAGFGKQQGRAESAAWR